MHSQAVIPNPFLDVCAEYQNSHPRPLTASQAPLFLEEWEWSTAVPTLNLAYNIQHCYIYKGNCTSSMLVGQLEFSSSSEILTLQRNIHQATAESQKPAAFINAESEHPSVFVFHCTDLRYILFRHCTVTINYSVLFLYTSKCLFSCVFSRPSTAKIRLLGNSFLTFQCPRRTLWAVQ